MDIKERLRLIGRNTEEILTEKELEELLASGKPVKHYIGFEISGKVHLGTGIVCMAKVKDFMDAGIETTVFLADWHTWINEKLGGDLETIKRVAVGYFKEALKASFQCVGGDPAKLNFVLGSDLYREQGSGYLKLVAQAAQETTLARAKRSITIMGRKEGEEGKLAVLLYPMMQAADVFALGSNLPHGGTDQRKAHVIARDVAPALNLPKPVAVHHHLILGLGKPPLWPIPKDKKQELWESMKMSKSAPQSAIFIHDSPETIREKVQKAFCPPEETAYNPLLDWVKHVLFLGEEGELEIKRSGQHGGNISVSSEELSKLYAAGQVHPEDLKNAVAERLITMLEPARKHFASGELAEMLRELEELLKK